MGSSVKKVKKVAKSPLGQLALSVAIGNSPFMAGIGGSGLAGSALRAGLTSGLVGVASGRGIDPKRMLTAGATAGLFKGVGNVQADRNFFDSGISNTGALSSALDPAKVKGVDTFAEEQFNPIAEQVNITPSAAPKSFTETFGDINYKRGAAVPTRLGESRIMPGTGIEEIAAAGGIAPAPGIIAPVITPTGIDAGTVDELTAGTALNNSNVGTGLITKDDGSGIRDIFSTKDGLSLGDRFTNVQDSLSAGNYMDALKQVGGAVADRPLSAIALTSMVAGAMQQVPKGSPEYEKRKSSVESYLRKYGSNFYKGEELDDFVSRNLSEYAVGGRVGYAEGSDDEDYKEMAPDYIPTDKEIELMERLNKFNKMRERYEELEDKRQGFKNGSDKVIPIIPKGVFYKGKAKDYPGASKAIREALKKKRDKKMDGGITDIPMGTPRMNKGGITELDYRKTGGFVPVGVKEKADDVPAMLSKNEFVMTADAVRGMGNGSVKKGAQQLYDQMKQAEKMGRGVNA